MGLRRRGADKKLRRIKKRTTGTPSIEDRIRFMREHRKKVTKSPEAALAFLVRAGILTPTGRLRKSYRRTE